MKEKVDTVWITHVPGRRGCPVIPMGAIPRLFIAVAQAVGSDIGKPIGMESRLRFLPLSAERKKVMKSSVHILNFLLDIHYSRRL